MVEFISIFMKFFTALEVLELKASAGYFGKLRS